MREALVLVWILVGVLLLIVLAPHAAEILKPHLPALRRLAARAWRLRVGLFRRRPLRWNPKHKRAWTMIGAGVHIVLLSALITTIVLAGFAVLASLAFAVLFTEAKIVPAFAKLVVELSADGPAFIARYSQAIARTGLLTIAFAWLALMRHQFRGFGGL